MKDVAYWPLMGANGLRQGEEGLEVYAMGDVPSNAVLTVEFLRGVRWMLDRLERLTQLTPGLDRDSWCAD